MTDAAYTLWGVPNSLYTGKIRSYLIKKRLAYAEFCPSHPRFAEEVRPRVGLTVAPVLETPQGETVQDTTAMIDLLESRHPEPVLAPPGPVQQVVAALLDAYGSNYMLALAMHYRWSFRESQELFIRTDFARTLPPMPYAERIETAGRVMAKFAGFLPNLGVLPEVIPAMEASYAELLAALEAHFQLHPYLLGGRPSVADFGMMAPLFAHLARDPVPSMLMKATAPNVFRWTERMNDPAIRDPDFVGYGEDFPAGDALPETLEAVLVRLFADWIPGLTADAACFNSWLAGLADPAPGTLVSHDGRRQVHPHVGRIEYPWRGVTMRRASHPHSLWHVARAQALAAALDGETAARFSALLERTGGKPLMAITTARPIAREDNVLVLV